jgi:hypothetical protein
MLHELPIIISINIQQTPASGLLEPTPHVHVCKRVRAQVYFLVSSLVEKYNNIYVYRRQYESSGQLWATVRPTKHEH